ncbi:MAG: MBOAT, membrane-bound O-acyltransferase family-domain-containing protein [Lentinula lateritia]|uniref:O-acyltransferase n=1 Tax=Lentinula lateritia TaxID=40482 RepID=A0ABQ8V9C1_9AGAR|nr:MAG: MBOAT, membrane-bound O-acyltransferase family-domain-containing protein [Lentinula lateritia]KAJ4481828.1 MBOAT, membrane-bound O-acyltransferase family-domain-containing protein [Lentinula lateritia]
MPIDGQNTQRTISSEGFQTLDGTLYVSKPFKSKSSKKLRALITFAPRQSTFDINNERSVANEFRGFFSLFWISIFIFTVRTYVRSIETNGHALNLAFATMFSKDAITLALSDAVLVGSTSICVVFAKAISAGWIRYYWTGLAMQHIFQTTVLIIAVGWTFNRQWPWVQSGFFTLHSLVMIMKMHSYMTVNGYLQWVSEQSQAILDQLREATNSEGGWDYAVRVAKEHRAELDAASTIGSSQSSGTSPMDTPPIPDGVQASYVDPDAAKALRKRLASMSDANGVIDADTKNIVDSLNDPNTYKKTDEHIPSATAPHLLIDHPNQNISNLAKDYSELQGELVSTGPLYIVWPNNITLKNFAVYMLIPTLVYELEYPRTSRIRPIYVFEKTVATFGTFVLLYTVTESFILPYTPTYDQSFFRSLLDLALPFMMAYLLLFYIIFECICNAFAELSCFADRQFYEDWWNSTSQAEFSRKWNKPVHSFLLRHVYASTMTSHRLSKQSAMFVTFLLSACIHELVMVVVTKKFRFYLFALQLIQIPLIALNSVPFIKRSKLLGNLMFWLGLYAGFPLLCVAYVAY